MFKAVILDICQISFVFNGLVSMIVLPGQEGQLSIVDFHQPIVSYLTGGTIEIDKTEFISIKRGIARMEKNGLTVLVER